MADKRKILIVDDHPVLRRGLAMLINAEPDMTVCGEADDVASGWEAVVRTRPDIVLVDIFLKDSNGLQLIKQIRNEHHSVPVLAISMHDELVYAERSLRAGAQGYITKQAAEEKIIHAIRRILAGKIYLGKSTSPRLTGSLNGNGGAGIPFPIGQLSDRELEVFQFIGQGLRASQIAEKMQLSVKTIETYQSHIKDKLKLSNSRELNEYAVAWMKARLSG